VRVQVIDAERDIFDKPKDEVRDMAYQGVTGLKQDLSGALLVLFLLPLFYYYTRNIFIYVFIILLFNQGPAILESNASTETNTNTNTNTDDDGSDSSDGEGDEEEGDQEGETELSKKVRFISMIYYLFVYFTYSRCCRHIRSAKSW
jgi:hypothetical protein